MPGTPHSTTPELAARLNVHLNTAKRLIRRGYFPNAFRLTAQGPWRIPESDIVAWIDRRKAATHTKG